jgi:hypothetical protein
MLTEFGHSGWLTEKLMAIEMTAQMMAALKEMQKGNYLAVRRAEQSVFQ